MLLTLLKTILIYLIIVFGLRMMGKRQLGELQPSELVVTILVSNIATLPIEDSNIPLLGGIVPILTLVSFEVLISALTLKSRTLRRIISGNPRILIRDGVIDQREMRNLRFSVDDLMEQLRANSIFDLQEVAFAIVETTGKLSIYQKFRSRPVTAGMLELTPSHEDSQMPPTVVISDGQILYQALSYCNLTPSRLEQILSQKGLAASQVFLMSCDSAGNSLVVPKDPCLAKTAERGGKKQL